MTGVTLPASISSLSTTRSSRFAFARAAAAGDVGPDRLGDLPGERPPASRRADDQHLLPRLNPSHVAKTLERGAAGGGNGRRLLEVEVRRLGRNLVLPSCRVLGEGAAAGAEQLIARLELRDILAD